MSLLVQALFATKLPWAAVSDNRDTIKLVDQSAPPWWRSVLIETSCRLLYDFLWGNYPEESTQQSEHGESLKSRILQIYWKVCLVLWPSFVCCAEVYRSKKCAVTGTHQLKSQCRKRNIIHSLIFTDPCIVVWLSRNTNKMQFVIEFIIPKFIEDSTCFERHTAHHQEL